MTNTDQKLLSEIQSIIDWLIVSKKDFIGETQTNALFTIERLSKILKDNRY